MKEWICLPNFSMPMSLEDNDDGVHRLEGSSGGTGGLQVCRIYRQVKMEFIFSLKQYIDG